MLGLHNAEIPAVQRQQGRDIQAFGDGDQRRIHEVETGVSVLLQDGHGALEILWQQGFDDPGRTQQLAEYLAHGVMANSFRQEVANFRQDRHR